MSSDLTRLADRISQLSPEKKDRLAKLLSSDRTLVDAIVRQSHFKQIIDLCLKMLAIVANTRPAWVLREELAYHKRKRDCDRRHPYQRSKQLPEFSGSRKRLVA